MKPLLPNCGINKLSNITLVQNGVVTTEPRQVVEIFNSYFADVVSTNHRENDFNDHPSVNLIASKMLLDQFVFQPVSCGYVRQILDNLNPRKAVGVDGISPRLLRLAAPILTEEIIQLINYLIMNQSWLPNGRVGT